jgi:hypothetical protein
VALCLSLLCKEAPAAPAGAFSAKAPGGPGDDASYPRARDLLAIDAWLQRTGGPGAGRALLVTGRAAYVRAPATPRPGRLALRQEVLTPTAAVALGGRSARLFLTVDCAARTATLESVEVHPGPGLNGPAHPLAPGRWRRVDPEAEAGDFVLLGCGPLSATPDGPAPSAAAPSISPPSAPTPSAPTPSAPNPSAPIPTAPIPSAPIPSAPTDSIFAPGASPAPARPPPPQVGLLRSWGGASSKR